MPFAFVKPLMSMLKHKGQCKFSYIFHSILNCRTCIRPLHKYITFVFHLMSKIKAKINIISTHCDYSLCLLFFTFSMIYLRSDRSLWHLLYGKCHLNFQVSIRTYSSLLSSKTLSEILLRWTRVLHWTKPLILLKINCLLSVVISVMEMFWTVLSLYSHWRVPRCKFLRK